MVVLTEHLCGYNGFLKWVNFMVNKANYFNKADKKRKKMTIYLVLIKTSKVISGKNLDF